MRIDRRFTILGLCIIVFIISIIIGISFAVPESLISSEYEIKNNTIYAVPTTYNFRVEELLSKLTSESDLTVYNKNNEELKYGDKVSTGYTLKQDDNTYNIVVLGDVTSDGLINLGDVSKLYNSYKGKTELNDIESKAGDTASNNKIDLSDVSKLYNYSKGKTAFSYFDNNMITIDNIVSNAESYYELNKTSNKLGTNLINELSSNNNTNDQVVITKTGGIEVAIEKNNKCYRKSALSDYVDVVDDYYCEVDITKFASNNRRLHVNSSKLVNEYNEEIRLTGVSNSEPPNNSEAIKEQGTKMFSDKSMHTLHIWGGNVFRIFMNRKYITWIEEDKHNKLMSNLKDAMDNMINNDMYIILNWSPGGIANVEYAKAFFREISALYPNDYHVIYEIWNEPNDVTWQDVKDYANEVIPAIRELSPDAICLVGSPKWDSRLDYVVEDPLDIDNIMYSHHTYMNQFSSQHLSYLEQAIDAGLPVFETECQSVASGIPTGSYVNDSQAYTFFKILERKNISYALFSWDAGMWSYNFVAYKEHKWDESLPDSIMREAGKFSKKLLRGNLDTTAYMMKENSNINVGTDYRSSEWKDKIISVSFKKNKEIPSNAVITWDLSYLQDNTIIGYLKPSTTPDMYDLVIASDREINLPSRSIALFKGLTNVTSYDFTNARTDMVTSIAYMFAGNTSIESIDLSSFDTDDLADVGYMFTGCSNLRSINFENWHPVVYDFVSVFYGCTKLESLDLSGFDMTNAKNFNSAFNGATSLQSLNISTWTPNSVSSLKNMFAGCSLINTIDLSGFTTFKNDADLTDVLLNVNPEVIVKTGNDDFKNSLKEIYPSLNIQ